MFAARMWVVGLVALVGSAGGARASSDAASFTNRIRESLHLTPGWSEVQERPEGMGGWASSQAAFTDRVQASLGLPTPSEGDYSGTGGGALASAFTDRVQGSLGLYPASPEAMSGEQVRLIQRALSARGFTTDATGQLDPGTTASIMAFQRANDLPATGTVDDSTARALGFEPGQVIPVRGQGR